MQKNEELTYSYSELNEARQRLRLLEMKIQTLENRIARKYPDVSFLNYKDRKRVLVSVIAIARKVSSFIMRVTNSFAHSFTDNWWRWFCWVTFSGSSDDAGPRNHCG